MLEPFIAKSSLAQRLRNANKVGGAGAPLASVRCVGVLLCSLREMSSVGRWPPEQPFSSSSAIRARCRSCAAPMQDKKQKEAAKTISADQLKALIAAKVQAVPGGDGGRSALVDSGTGGRPVVHHPHCACPLRGEQEGCLLALHVVLIAQPGAHPLPHPALQ